MCSKLAKPLVDLKVRKCLFHKSWVGLEHDCSGRLNLDQTPYEVSIVGARACQSRGCPMIFPLKCNVSVLWINRKGDLTTLTK